jgi:hypothetical protein
MAIHFKPVEDVVHTIPVVFGFSAPAGGGKTYSALKMAAGIAKPSEIFMIDTEAGRGLAYRSEFSYQYASLDAPFSAENYWEAHKAAVNAGAKVIIIDSMSHEHEGEGGMLDQVEKFITDKAGNDWSKRDRYTMIAWAKFKPARNRFISYLMNSPVVTILCFQARPKTKPVKRPDGKTDIVDTGFQPVCGNEFTFALTAFARFDSANPGVPIFDKDSKPLMHQLAPIFPPGKKVDDVTGRLLKQWCGGEKKISNPKPKPEGEVAIVAEGRSRASEGVAVYTAWVEKLTPEQKADVRPFHKEFSDLAKTIKAGG